MTEKEQLFEENDIADYINSDDVTDNHKMTDSVKLLTLFYSHKMQIPMVIVQIMHRKVTK